MGATFTRAKIWIKEYLTFADLNAEFDNILTNLTPAGIDDHSVSNGQMQTQTAPFPASVISKPTSAAGEIERLRYMIASITGNQYWYQAPLNTLAALGPMDQWAPSGDVPTYVSAVSFTVPTDKTSVYTQGRRIKATIDTGSIIGTVVSSVSAGTPAVTTVTILCDASGLDATLSAVGLGIITPSMNVLPRMPVVAKVDDYSISILDHGKTIHANKATAISFTFPAASNYYSGFFVDIKNVGAGVLTLTGTIDGIVDRTVLTKTPIRVYTDGTSWFGQPIACSASMSTVRQTVQGGPVSAAGLPTFLQDTSASLNLSTQNISSTVPFVVSAANGFDAIGEVNEIGSSTGTLTWSGLTANSTCFLYVTVANGILTTGFTVLPPVYQWGGTPSVTNGQATYNIQQGKMFMGNGSAAVETSLVFVGEAVTGAGSVTSTIAYAYNGRYDSGYTATLPGAGTTASNNHNIGTTLVLGGFRTKCLEEDQGFAVGDIVSSVGASSMAQFISPTFTSRNAMQICSGNNSAFTVQHKTTGATGQSMTAAKWAYELYARREF